MNYRNWAVLSGLLILLAFSFQSVSANDDDDLLIGFDWGTPANDPPYFIDWFDTSEIIQADTNVSLFATVYDPDNISSEIILYLIYSNDNFVSDTNTIVMTFTNQTAVNTYNFTGTIGEQPAGTILRFYYSATDGGVGSTKPASGYFTLQWYGTPPMQIIGGGGIEGRFYGTIQIIALSSVLLMCILLFTMAIVTNVNVRADQSLKVSRDASIPRIAYEVGAFYIGQSVRLIAGGVRSRTQKGLQLNRPAGLAVTSAPPEYLSNQTLHTEIYGVVETVDEKGKNVFKRVYGSFKDTGSDIKYFATALIPSFVKRLVGKSDVTAPPERYQFQNPLAKAVRSAKQKIIGTSKHVELAQNRLERGVDLPAPDIQLDNAEQQLLGKFKKDPAPVQVETIPTPSREINIDLGKHEQRVMKAVNNKRSVFDGSVLAATTKVDNVFDTKIDSSGTEHLIMQKFKSKKAPVPTKPEVKVAKNINGGNGSLTKNTEQRIVQSVNEKKGALERKAQQTKNLVPATVTTTKISSGKTENRIKNNIKAAKTKGKSRFGFLTRWRKRANKYGNKALKVERKASYAFNSKRN